MPSQPAFVPVASQASVPQIELEEAEHGEQY
jgi:hypothetical protein